MKKKLLLLSSMLMLCVGMVHADDAVVVSVGDGTTSTQSAQFLVSQNPTLQFINGKAVMTMGEGTTHIAELPMENGAQLTFESGTYSSSTNNLSVTVTSADYATLYSAFQLEVPDGVEVYAPTYDQSTKMLKMNPSTIVEEGCTLPAGTGIVLRNQGTYSFAVSTAEPVAVNSALQGSAIAIPTSSITDGTVYSLANGEDGVAFYHYTGENIVAGKAFLVLNGNTAMSKGITFDFGDDATAISDAAESEVSAKDNIYYNLTGQRLSSPKGIVIVNGKKVVVK